MRFSGPTSYKKTLLINSVKRAGKQCFELKALTIFLAVLLSFDAGHAQYFGRNKPKYKTFDFKVLESPHFEIYHYLNNDSTANALARIHEHWYNRHNVIFGDTFSVKNPVIFYNHHPDFQQTRAIHDMVGIGTGGVTEGLKNRIIMPYLETNRQTDHVIGHELVHAFQFNMLTSGDSTSLYSLRNLPLWMVEGLAEYLSLGRTDAHTAMWMRDAILSNNFPTLHDLTVNPNYFPYRYGHAFWAFVTGIWGDKIIKPLFLATAINGYETAIDSLLKQKPKDFSDFWKNQLQEYYLEFAEDTIELVGRKIFGVENAGNINISPIYSPNAQYMAFISEKDVLTIDIFLVDVKTGRIIRKLSGANQQSHIDDFNFIESVGTFSPDSRYFAYTVVSKGKNALVVVDVKSGKTVREIFVPELEAFNYPNWSPDGRYIVMSGLKDGQSDLYLYDYRRHRIEQLTNDFYSDIQPSWSSDGNHIVFASERGEDTDPDNFKFGGFRICILDLHSGEIETLNIFQGADNLNPHFSPDNHMIYFLSNADGFRNLYEYSTVTGSVYRMTKYFTGISGITAFSPALTVARDNGLLAYSLYRNGKYSIFRADPADFNFVREKVDPRYVNFMAATLPPHNSIPVQESILLSESISEEKPVPADSLYLEKPYKPKFKLDYLGNHAVGILAGRFGTGLSGGVNALFSDILGNQQLFGAVALNGEIYDIGGQLAYVNQKKPLHWGATFSFIPHPSASISYFTDQLTIADTVIPVINEALDMLRTYETQAGLFTYYPISQTRRFEAGASIARYHYRLDRISNYYFQGNLIHESREKLPTPPAYFINRLDAAFVEDNSVLGMVGPLKGRRFRIGGEQFLGAANFRTLLVDYRQYFRIKPFSTAFRLYHYSRFGEDAESGILPPLFLGNPALVRGYHGNSFYSRLSIETGGFNINQLVGSRIMVANAEVRLPFTGPERLSMFKLNILPSELALFMDGGIAWDASGFSSPIGEDTRVNIRRQPVFSAGLSLRINVLGYMVVEPFYAIPLQRWFRGGVFGVNFTPAW